MSEYEKQRISQAEHGPTVEFEGKLLCETQYHIGSQIGGIEISNEIWETRAGNLVAVLTKTPDDESLHEVTQIAVVEVAGDEPSIDERCAVMEHFEWRKQARSMVRKIKWKLVRKVA